jgi:putative DNA primase/helicase
MGDGGGGWIDALNDDDERPSVELLAEEAPRCTDGANADAVAREHGKGFLFVHKWETWLAWDGRRWDGTGARARVLTACLLTARLEHYRCKGRLVALEEQLRALALAGQKDEDIEARLANEKRLLKWHEASQNIARLEAAVKILETRLTVTHEALDARPWLLNVANGTLDLRTAELHPHDRDDLLTQIADVEWSDGASSPTWDAFVKMAMGGKLELALYLQRLVGFAITGLTTEHVLAFFYGTGRNGKSTFVNALRRMLGEYACAAPRELLFESKTGERHPAELARLHAKRLAVCAEIGEFTTLDEAKVKDLTGGDAISVRRMREDFWDLQPTHTLLVSGNHRPVVRGDDLGIWRRIRLVPWLVTVADADVDTGLPEKLAAELPGILRWAVHGCLEWQRIGMAEPEEVLLATEGYRAESDSLGEFLDRYVLFGRQERCTKKALRERYEAWCEEQGIRPVPARRLGDRLRDRAVVHTTVRDMGRVRDGWRGARLRTEIELTAEAEPSTRDDERN